MMRGTGSALLALAAAVTLAACEKVTLPPDRDSQVPDSKVPDSKLVKPDVRVDGPRLDQNPAKPWAISAGGIGGDFATTVVRDSAGSLIITGNFHKSAAFGTTTLTATGPDDSGVFVAKLDAQGTFVWAIALPGVGETFIPATRFGFLNGLAVDAAGNIFVAAPFAGTAVLGTTSLTAKGDQDVFVAKLSPTGQVLWAVAVGGPGRDAVFRLVLGSAGNITVAGMFSGAATFGSVTRTAKGTYDGFVARLDGNGQVLWVVQASAQGTTDGEESALGLALDGTGNTYVTGMFYGTATIGSFTLAAKDVRDTYVAKLDSSGNVLWAVTPPYPKGISVTADVQLDGSGNLYLAGGAVGQRYSAAVAKVDPADGKFIWAKSADSTGADSAPEGAWAASLVVDAAGYATVVGLAGGTTTFGAITRTSKGDKDIFVTRLDPSGTFLWAELAGSTGYDGGFSITSDGTSLYIAGAYRDTVTLGGTTLTSRGDWDAFVWKRPAL